MNLSEEIAKLHNLHWSGALNDDEFAQAKAALIAGASGQPAPDIARLEEQLRELEIESELARLDREWEAEREHYMVRNKDGSLSEPDAVMSLLGGIGIIVFGIIWAISTGSSHAPGFFPVIGILMVVVGIVTAVSGRSRANQYDAACYRYREKRAHLLAQRNAGK